MPGILAADIGGTNSRFGHFIARDAERVELVSTTWIKTAQARSFGELLELLPAQGFDLPPAKADIAVIAIAGAVEDGVRCTPSNIPWSIDLGNAARDFGLRRVALINDFVAQAFACRSPVAERCRVLLPGDPAPDGAIAAIGAGTGLGKCALLPVECNGRREYRPIPSEGGHTDIPFLTRAEFEYQEFLRNMTGRGQIIGDIVLSGRGLALLHEFHTGQALSPPDAAACCNESPLCPTVEWYARFYARSCRNYVLEVLARGGIFITGGVAAKNPCLVEHPAFAEEFRFSPTHGDLIAKVPVRLNSDENAGLWGAATCGAQLLQLP